MNVYKTELDRFPVLLILLEWNRELYYPYDQVPFVICVVCDLVLVHYKAEGDMYIL